APHNPDVPPLTEYSEMAKNHFLHIEYFRPVGPADEALNAAPREFLTKVYYALSGDFDFGQVMAHPPGTTYLDALPAELPPLPWSWLSEEDMDILVAAYTRSGFTGGLNWYRSMDIKWQERKAFENYKSDVPAYFIGSENDVDLEHFHGDDPIEQMRKHFPNLVEIQMVPQAGHMVQLERDKEVSQVLVDFLEKIVATSS
ncbi:MAG: alpha/beta fold hydrolase, partial [Pseudomonadales bacterium]